MKSDFHNNINMVNKLFSIARKGQLIVKDIPKVKVVMAQLQVERTQIEKELGPRKPNRNRYKPVTV